MTNIEDAGWIGRWSPGIGDPTIAGWLTVAIYAVAAVMCWRAAQASRKLQPLKSVRPLETTLWWLLSIVLCFLCINKQLDLQTAMTEFARMLSRRDGWYAERRAYQQMFVVGLVLGGALCASLLLVITWKMSRSIKLAMLGLCLLGVFILTRASSFHHFDVFIGSSVLGIKWNWILEISGIGVIALAAYRRLQHVTNPTFANQRI
ncbi:MAG: hypothetical protein KJ795_05235 [Gammaproteobacteria bacterium]|nr:hypothetical protein [Gammaproteobacteria bacterium]MBU1969430.1 hypothetical protein [Gammaproteobacteria bacterium]